MTSPPEQDPNKVVEESASSRPLAMGLKFALSSHGLPCKSGELPLSMPPPQAPLISGAASSSAAADTVPRADEADPGQNMSSDSTGEPEAASLVAEAQAFAALEAEGGGDGDTEGVIRGIQTIANSFGRSGAWREAGLMLSLLPEGDGLVYNYNATIAACEKGQQWHAALRVLMHMLSRSVQPNAITSELLKRAMHQDVFPVPVAERSKEG